MCSDYGKGTVGMDYFIFNKALDYERGYRQNLVWNDNGFGIRDLSDSAPGIFISRILDSGEAKNQWHRLKTEFCLGDNMAITLRIYASDSETGVKRLEGLLRNGNIPPQQMTAAMEPYFKLEARNRRDLLLTQVKGRFLWIMALIYGNSVESPWVYGMQLWFHGQSWSRFLPEIYQELDFLERYLAVFQTFYDEMDHRIREDAACLDIRSVAPTMLMVLADWLAAEDRFLWEPDRLRVYLDQGIRVYKKRGTRAGLFEKIALFTGEEPCVLEPDEEEGRECLTVWIREQAVPDEKSYQALLRIIQKEVPAWTAVRLVTWKPYLVLGLDTCLGINSRIKDWDTVRLDGMSMISRGAIGGKTD